MPWKEDATELCDCSCASRGGTAEREREKKKERERGKEGKHYMNFGGIAVSVKDLFCHEQRTGVDTVSKGF